MADLKLLSVEVAYARPDQQWLYSLQVPAGTTAGEAVQLSQLPTELPGVDWINAPLGIFGRVVEKDCRLADGDRVEVYRSLLKDPKEARRLRAAKGAAD